MYHVDVASKISEAPMEFGSRFNLNKNQVLQHGDVAKKVVNVGLGRLRNTKQAGKKNCYKVGSKKFPRFGQPWKSEPKICRAWMGFFQLKQIRQKKHPKRRKNKRQKKQDGTACSNENSTSCALDEVHKSSHQQRERVNQSDCWNTGKTWVVMFQRCQNKCFKWLKIKVMNMKEILQADKQYMCVCTL